MAIKFKSYYKTTELTEEQLVKAIERCKSQEKTIYELFQKFGKMTEHDVDDVLYLIGKPILKNSLGRSMSNLRSSNSIIQVGQIDGPFDVPVGLFEVTDNPPVSQGKQIPKSFSTDIVFREDGTINEEKTIENAITQIDNIINRHNL